MHYVRPETLKDAVSALQASEEEAYILAGGTDLLVRMKSQDLGAAVVVDIKSIEGIAGVSETDDHFRIGAATTCTALREHAGLVSAWPGVVEAANLIGSTQIQARCTIVGNLCNASPAADSVPALIAAGARAVVVGPDGSREVAVDTVVTGPGQTSLGKGEFIEAILLDKPPPKGGDAYLRFIPRTEMDIAVVGAAVSLNLGHTGEIVSARVALGAVAPTAIVVEDAATALIGSTLDANVKGNLAAMCASACRPIADKRGTVEFRKHVAGVLAVRAAEAAFIRAGEN